MFVRGLARVGEYQSRGWKMEDWYKYPGVATSSIIPGVANTTAVVAAGGGLLALAAAWAAAKYFKIF